MSLARDLYIGGEWVPAEGDKRFVVLDPGNAETIAEVADASPADGRRALDAAVSAQESWASTSPRDRGELLRRAFDLLTARSEEFATLMTREMGKPLAEARAEVAYGAEFLRWFSEEAVRITGRYGDNPAGTGKIVVSHRPVGPCFLITPWNFPLAMATRKIAPALAAGCTVVVKPAAPTPLTTLAFVRLLEEVGLPTGVVNVIPTSQSSAVSAPIIADSRLRKLSFTGSTNVGRALMKQAADGILRTSMELGGNAPFVVFEDADLDEAVAGALIAKFRNVGQACTAANRFIVHADIAAEFATRLSTHVAAMRVGHGLEPETVIGPLIDEGAVTSAAELVRDAVERGADLLAGGHPIERPGTYFEPTVLTNVGPGTRLLSEEIFGPVLAISTFTSDDEAVSLANDTEYGLASYVYTRDLGRAHRMIDLLATGMMGINAGAISDAAAPFGGIKMSGLGREGSVEGIHEYLDLKYSFIPNL
ncbi:Succinate-semialdehyde dehydrogenase [Microbacterium oxydans]|uniref:NAD-dependent succinate-semialdehyde dehydrogenase n=1 Tax=Microbacterium oxydans TaxID=82380 RepID=UPI001E0168FA|nr:NAD-dependent succinate-semialdehyde dehydrogenase [Microbacterium oxydans]CAH0177141.1 Succinate-semialdehyde dehydrogenase [Microbacterium oxydans]